MKVTPQSIWIHCTCFSLFIHAAQQSRNLYSLDNGKWQTRGGGGVTRKMYTPARTAPRNPYPHWHKKCEVGQYGTRAVTGTHFATRVPAYQYPTGTRVPVKWMQHLLSFITRVVLSPAGTRVPVYSSIWHPSRQHMCTAVNGSAPFSQLRFD